MFPTPTPTPVPTSTPSTFGFNGLPPAPPFLESGPHLNIGPIHESLNIQYSILPYGYADWPSVWIAFAHYAINIFLTFWVIFEFVAGFIMIMVFTAMAVRLYRKFTDVE